MQSKKRVLFYLVDGAHAEVLPELLEQGHLPNIQRVINEGTYRKATTCFPSTTGPAYLPFLTGHFPGTMDITGIRWFDKKEFKRTRFNKMAMRSYCGPEAAWFNTDMPADKPTLFELMGESYNVYNMITRNVPDEYDLGKKGKGPLYMKAHFKLRHHPVDIQGHGRVMEMLNSGKDFDFLFAVFPSVDWDSHYHHIRDERTVEAYKIVDRSLGEVRAKLEEQGRWDDTLFVLTSDHGLTPTTKHLDLGDWMTAQGLKAVYYPVIWKTNPKSAVFISGNSFGAIHLLNHKGDHVLRETEILQAMGGDKLELLLKEDAVDFAIYRGDDENTFIVHNRYGKARIAVKDDVFTYEPLTADVLKYGGKIEATGHRDILAKTFETDYPDAVFQIYQLFRSRRAGDIVISAAVGYDLRDFWEYPEHKGSHGSLHRHHIHVPLIYNQKGWKDFPARTADLFDSILKWNGITPKSSEGEPLF
ncbi:alkaline phosphatase family protein [Mucilaginibacter achroorhodeus]|uniref:Alkaline phosphatase family protein n=1 Tax=Mucilaginibacter achroorhodeus TaxID=2599294 RepID=A0A563U0P9_9SPHI|nr:alkaline phosphatase family protein [Mucilaginibacter achroorhodeus]TWR24582.1 alkaline phosphatase family protein [Mucilaginibacter achroorhodeus]